MEAAATVVLPVHNAERTLRSTIVRILEAVEPSTQQLQLVIIDDGSTDGTFEAACELASQFPQVRVLRQSPQSGLGLALEQIRRRLNVRQVIAHDGAGPIAVDELLNLLRDPAAAESPSTAAGASGAPVGRGSRRIGAVGTLDARMSKLRQSTGSLRWLRLDESPAPRRKCDSAMRFDNGAPLVASLDGLRANTCTIPLALQ